MISALFPFCMSGYIDFQDLNMSDSNFLILNLDISKYRQSFTKSKMSTGNFGEYKEKLRLTHILSKL